MTDEDRAALLSGETVVGEFAVAPAGRPVAAALRWSGEDGATLELINDVSGFPRSFDVPRFTVYGTTRRGGDLSLHDCMIRTLALGDQPARLTSSLLLWGEHTLPRETWPRAIYRTANLSEWRDDSGFERVRNETDGRADGFDLRWRPPVRDDVDVAGAQITFTGHLESSSLANPPDISMRTHGVLVVNARRPLTVARHRTQYLQPLLSLLALACDRPEGVTSEVYLDPATGRRIEAWQRGWTLTEGDWRGRLLFGADAIVDYPKAIRAWWRLHKRVWPALDLFADHLNEGSGFSTGRFLTAFAAAEVYGRARHKTKDLKRLRDYADVDSALLGCTNASLDLISVSRGYFSHYNNLSRKYSRAAVENSLPDSTRRLSALMQACLLRDLGFSRATREELLRRHYQSWPLA